MVLASTVEVCVGGTFTRASFMSRRRCTCTAGCVAHAAFAACAAATVSAAAASASAAPFATLAALAALAALCAVAVNLTRLAACLDAGAWLAAR